jgi:hypothetical protein
MLPEFGSIIFWRFATLWQDALLHSGPAPAIGLLRRPSPAAKPAVGMPIPELSDRLREKACPSLLNIKLYCIVYIRRAVTTGETVHEKSPSWLKSVGGNTMHKFFLALILLSVPVSTGALAHSGSEQEQQACTRDVQRFCRKLTDQGDFTILACLKENRPKLSSACRDVLVSHGQ